MNELKPCPFCGREAVVKRSSDFRYYVMCGKCEVKTHKYIVKSDAIKAWNRRADVNFVRCLNCKYLKADTLDQKAVYFCTQNVFAKRRIKLDDFCSYVERKDGGENA